MDGSLLGRQNLPSFPQALAVLSEAHCCSTLAVGQFHLNRTSKLIDGLWQALSKSSPLFQDEQQKALQWSKALLVHDAVSPATYPSSGPDFAIYKNDLPLRGERIS